LTATTSSIDRRSDGNANDPTTCGKLRYGKLSADGWTIDNDTWQGVRTNDGSVGQWNTPDPFAGDAHDPMSQKPFMWNRNNPYAYSDPTGYCLPECAAPAAIVVAGEAVAVGAEVEIVTIGAAEVAEFLGARAAAQAMRTVVARVNSYTWQQVERANSWAMNAQVKYMGAATGLNRIADYLSKKGEPGTTGTIGESKYTQVLSLTSQMKDSIGHAANEKLTLVLQIASDTKLSKPLIDALQDWVKSGGTLIIELVKR
jgi:hypothetical protein